MYEIAEPTSHAAFAAIKPTACFAKVRHGRQLAVDGPRSVPARVERVTGLLRRVFVLEAGIDVADEVVVVVVADDDFFNLAVLAHLGPEVLVEGVEVVLELGGVHLVLGVIGGVLIEVW